jgi:antitoxin component YwqK of YwqJK toxin-antitoxin module
MKKSILTLFILLPVLFSIAQAPKYTEKHFKTNIDTTISKIIVSKKDGFQRTYLLAHPPVWDLDDDSTTWVRPSTKAVVIVEGNMKRNKREGLFTFFLIDSLNPGRRYKLWEQTFVGDKLNGRWNTFSMNGVLCSYLTYKNDSLNGIAKELWIDGKTTLREFEYFGGQEKYLVREYHANGKIKAEIPYQGDKLHGFGRKFYEGGNLLETVNLTNGEFDGTWKYYYPSGQLWIEKVYRKGKTWDILANFTSDGKKRNAGTLKDGNGTAIYYNEDGTVREVITYKDGVEVK